MKNREQFLCFLMLLFSFNCTTNNNDLKIEQVTNILNQSNIKNDSINFEETEAIPLTVYYLCDCGNEDTIFFEYKNSGIIKLSNQEKYYSVSFEPIMIANQASFKTKYIRFEDNKMLLANNVSTDIEEEIVLDFNKKIGDTIITSFFPGRWLPNCKLVLVKKEFSKSYLDTIYSYKLLPIFETTAFEEIFYAINTVKVSPKYGILEFTFINRNNNNKIYSCNRLIDIILNIRTPKITTTKSNSNVLFYNKSFPKAP